MIAYTTSVSLTPSHCAKQWQDKAYIVGEGHIIAQGDAETILADKKVRKVYLGEDFSL